MIKIKRIYEPASKDDGYRVLVDRLWPRGIAKAMAGIDLWLKDVAPSNDLRKWFGHDPQKWPEFRKKYKHELSLNKEATNQLREIVKSQKDVTLLYATRDQEHNEAKVIQEFLNENMC